MTWPALALALIIIDPETKLIDPGDFQVVTTTSSVTILTESTTTTSDTSTTSSSASTSSTTSSTLPAIVEWFVSTTGSDSSGDGSRAAPFKTATKALTVATDGDWITLLDNPDSSSHIPVVVNKAGITLRCEHEGQCAILTTGKPGIEITAPRVTIEGIAVKSADSTTGLPHNIFAHDTTQVRIRRVIAGWNNRCKNAHPIRFERMTNSEVVESACLQHSRHCISDHRGDGNRFLRNWIHGKGRTESSSCPPEGGTSRESIACYPCSRALIANNLIEGSQDWGINVNASDVATGNVIAGNIIVGTFVGGKVYARPTGWPVNTVVRDHVVARATPSFDFRDQVSINTLYDRLTFFAGATSFEVDNPSSSSAQLSCADVPGTPSIAIRDSLLGKLVVEACTGKTRGCAVSNVIATSSTLMAGCLVSSLTGTLPPSLGDTGLGKSLVLPIDGRGADVRCVLDDAGTRTTESLWDASGQWRHCPPVRIGWNDAGDTCATYGARRLNHKPDGTGAPLARLACPP